MSKTSRRHLAVGLEDDRERAVRLATASRSAERWRCIHRGVRWPGRRRGSSSARAAFSRKRAAKSAEPPAPSHDSSSISSGSSSERLDRRAASTPSGRRTAIRRRTRSPAPRRRAARAAAPRSRSPTARGRGRRTARGCRPASRRARRGSARRRSCDRSGARRWPRAASSRYATGSRRELVEGGVVAQPRSPPRRRLGSSSRRKAPMRTAQLDRPPDASPCQNGILPGSPGAGVTITRSGGISSMRQVEAPSRNVSPDPRLVDHLLVELADPRPPARRRPAGRRRTSPRSGIVPPLVIATTRASLRGRHSSVWRSQTTRGLRSANSSDG